MTSFESNENSNATENRLVFKWPTPHRVERRGKSPKKSRPLAIIPLGRYSRRRPHRRYGKGPPVTDSAPQHESHPPLSRGQVAWRWKILISTYTAYAGYYLCRKVFSICKTTLAEEFDVGLDVIAHIWTVYLVAYMVGQFVNSFLGRKWGPRVLLLGGLGISILCNVVFGFANSYSTFMVFMAFNGLVQASGWPGAVGGISEWLRDHERGSIMGVWTTCFVVGNLTVKGLGGHLLGVYGWRWSFWGCTLLTFAIWWIIYFWQRDRPEDVGLEPIVSHDENVPRTVAASQSKHITAKEYWSLATNPIIIAMGMSYFSIKFLRYALDSWLPAFLNIQGLDVAQASYYSSIFDFAGLGGAIVAGVLLDRVFKGNWAALCMVLGVGLIVGYIAVIQFGGNPYAMAISFGLVGFMLYGPDTILSGAACIQVAGERNAVAVAGLVNGLGSIGPVIQEEVIGWLVRGDMEQGMRNTNYLALAMSVMFLVMMTLLYLRLRSSQQNSAP